jgi:predicted RNase H-like HicB family nuclease
MKLSAFLIPAQQGGYVAFNPETATNSQGESAEEALANLKKATELYLEECSEVSAREYCNRPTNERDCAMQQ